IALSLTESEYITLTNTCHRLLWLKQLLHDMRLHTSTGKPILVGNNISSHYLTHNPALH
ncbi:hypothetical protein L873DRAFT_1724851, partial [Choiromyces venosus 120613-1]